MSFLSGNARYITGKTGCIKPCKYKKYRLIGDYKKPNMKDGLLVLWSMADDKMVSKFAIAGCDHNFAVETEHVIYWSIDWIGLTNCPIKYNHNFSRLRLSN